MFFFSEVEDVSVQSRQSPFILLPSTRPFFFPPPPCAAAAVKQQACFLTVERKVQRKKKVSFSTKSPFSFSLLLRDNEAFIVRRCVLSTWC
jgi:hypothetical protein